MSVFDEWLLEEFRIPKDRAVGYYLDLTRPTIPGPTLEKTSAVQAGLLKLALLEELGTPAGALDEAERLALTDPEVQAAVDYQQAQAEKENYAAQLEQTQQELQAAQQQIQQFEQQSAQAQQQAAQLEEQLNQETAAKQQAISEASALTEQGIADRYETSKKREEISMLADDLKGQLEQAKQQVDAVQQQVVFGAAPPPGAPGVPPEPAVDPNAPAGVQQEQQEAENASLDADIQQAQAEEAEAQVPSPQPAAPPPATPPAMAGPAPMAPPPGAPVLGTPGMPSPAAPPPGEMPKQGSLQKEGFDVGDHEWDDKKENLTLTHAMAGRGGPFREEYRPYFYRNLPKEWQDKIDYIEEPGGEEFRTGYTATVKVPRQVVEATESLGSYLPENEQPSDGMWQVHQQPVGQSTVPAKPSLWQRLTGRSKQASQGGLSEERKRQVLLAWRVKMATGGETVETGVSPKGKSVAEGHDSPKETKPKPSSETVAPTVQKLTDITDQQSDALDKEMLEDQSGEVPEQKKEAWARNEWEAWLLKEAQDEAQKANQQALVEELSQLEPDQLAQILEGSTVDRLKPAAMGLLQDTEQMGEEPPQTETALDLENVDPEALEELVNQLDDEEIEELSDELEDQQEAQTKQAALRAVQAWRKRKQAYVGVSIPIDRAPLDPEIGAQEGERLGRGIGAFTGTLGGAGLGSLSTVTRKSLPLRVGATLGGALLGGAAGTLGGGAAFGAIGRRRSEHEQERYKTDVQQKLRLMQEAVDAYKARRAQELEQYVRPMSSGGYMLGSSSNPLPASEAPEGQFVTLREGPTRVKTFRDGPSVARRAMGGPGPIDPDAQPPGGDAWVQQKTGARDTEERLQRVLGGVAGGAIEGGLGGSTTRMRPGLRGVLAGATEGGIGAAIGGTDWAERNPFWGQLVFPVSFSRGGALGGHLAGLRYQAGKEREAKLQKDLDYIEAKNVREGHMDPSKLAPEHAGRVRQLAADDEFFKTGSVDLKGYLEKQAANYLPPDFEQRARALQSQLDENPIRGYEAPHITPEDEAGMRADSIRSGGRVLGALTAPIGGFLGYAGGEMLSELNPRNMVRGNQMAQALRSPGLKRWGGAALGTAAAALGGRALGRRAGAKDWEETSPETRQMTANVEQASELAERGLIDPRIADETERQYMEAMNADFDRQQMGLPKTGGALLNAAYKGSSWLLNPANAKYTVPGLGAAFLAEGAYKANKGFNQAAARAQQRQQPRAKMASEGVDLSGYIERLATGS